MIPSPFYSLNPYELARLADCASPDSIARPTDGLRCPDCGREWPNMTGASGDVLATSDDLPAPGHWPGNYEDHRKPDTFRDACPGTPEPATVPEGDDSPGAAFLRSIAYGFDADEYREADESDDYIHERADDAPSVYNFQRWQEFTDLAAWQEDLDELGGCPTEDDGSPDLTGAAGVALYMIAERLLRALADALPTVYAWRFDPDPNEDGDYAVTIYHAHPGTDDDGNAYDAGDEVETDYLRADQFEGMSPEAVAVLLPTMARTFATDLAEQNDGELTAEVAADA